jgi:hypothetical protein
MRNKQRAGRVPWDPSRHHAISTLLCLDAQALDAYLQERIRVTQHRLRASQKLLQCARAVLSTARASARLPR